MHPSPLPPSLSIFFHRRIRKLNANQPETRFTCNKSRAYGWDNIDKIVVKRCFIPVERVERLVSPLVKCIHVSRNKNKKKKYIKTRTRFRPFKQELKFDEITDNGLLTCYKFCPREFVMATLIFITVQMILRLTRDIFIRIFIRTWLWYNLKSKFQYGGKFLIIKLHLECWKLELFHEIPIEIFIERLD